MKGRKRPPAELRTGGLFNGGLSPLEEAERMLVEEEDRDETINDERAFARDNDSIKRAMTDAAIQWLSSDVFEDGDDVLLALDKKGDGVMMAVTAGRNSNVPSRQVMVRLSRKQLVKLKKIAQQIP